MCSPINAAMGGGQLETDLNLWQYMQKKWLLPESFTSEIVAPKYLRNLRKSMGQVKFVQADGAMGSFFLKFVDLDILECTFKS